MSSLHTFLDTTDMVLIANLLCTVISRMIKRHVSFSQLVTMLRLTLISSHLWKNPQNDELIIMAEKANAPPKELDLFD